MPAMNPRTWPRGKYPDFTLPKPNPNPDRMTDALWWLVCMREALEPVLSENGGTYANKKAYHNIGQNLPDYGLGNARTDASIRRAPDRAGPWWRTKTAAHDWTFLDAQRGDYRTISKYTNRLVNAMKDPKDPRPDNVYAYTIGQIDNDRVVEGYNEYDDENESGDETHLWHRHDSLRRNIVGDFWAMWKALTIDMGWTVAEWQRSLKKEEVKVSVLDNADRTFISGSSSVGLCTLVAWGSGGGSHALVGDAVLNTSYPRRSGDSRTPLWTNIQGLQADLDGVVTDLAAITGSQTALSSKLDMLTSDIADPGWVANDDPIVARVRYAIANP